MEGHVAQDGSSRLIAEVDVPEGEGVRVDHLHRRLRPHHRHRPLIRHRARRGFRAHRGRRWLPGGGCGVGRAGSREGPTHLRDLVHHLEVRLGPGDRPLAGIDDEAHHRHRGARHSHQLEQQHHHANAERPVRGLQEQHQVDAQESEVQHRPAGGVHGVPVPRLAAGQVDGGTVAGVEHRQLGALPDEALHHPDLADHLGEPAVGEVDPVVLLPFQALPVAGGPGGQPHVGREHHGQHHGQRPGVEPADHQHRHRRHQHGEERVGHRLEEVGDLGDRARQPPDDRAAELVVEVALRQAEQLLEVAHRQDLPQPGGHRVTEVAADVGQHGVEQFGDQQAEGQQHDRPDRATVPAGDGHHLVGGPADDEGGDQGGHRHQQRAGDDAEVVRPQFPGGGQDPDEGSHAPSPDSRRRDGPHGRAVGRVRPTARHAPARPARSGPRRRTASASRPSATAPRRPSPSARWAAPSA
ncbi:hypothetical protein SDC9_81975 [bioreactor metagenome]|uniref:Uncharacterized protein n=1 Tax=bioreactor metagenome TaxID=1076179 RepID=A0A644ZBW9_9ZZZZ